MSYYFGKNVTVGDGYMATTRGHVSWRHECGKPGMWSVNVIGEHPFNFSADAVVDDFGNLVRVGG